MQLHIYLQLIERYIKHAQCIASNSEGYKLRPEFNLGMKHCSKLLQWIEAYRSKITDEAVIKQVIRYSDYLWYILPYARNNSYQTCFKNLMRILEPATQYMDGERKAIQL